MTSPANATTDQLGRRTYTNPTQPDRTYASVTTIIREGVPKPLDSWLKKTTAEYAVDHHHEWDGLDRDVAVDLIKNAPDRHRDHRGDVGNAVHTHLEHVAQGHEPPDLLFSCPDAVDPARQGELFFAEWAPRILHLERTVYSDRYGYAGSFDFIADLPGVGRVIGDYKTSKSVYAETGLQLAAYRYADYMIDENGNQHDLPDVNGGVVVHLLDHQYQVVPVECDHQQFESFLAAQRVMHHRRNRTIVGRALEAPKSVAKIRRRNLVDRIATLRGIDGAIDALAKVWPETVPSLKQSEDHTADQLAMIGYRVDQIESEYGAPFNPPPRLDGATLTPPSNQQVGSDPGPIGSKERHALAIKRLENLPEDLLAEIETAATICDCPNLHTGYATDRQLDQIEAAIGDCETVYTERRKQVDVALAEACEDDADLIAAVYVTAAFDAERLPTEVDAERLTAVAHSLGNKDLIVAIDDDGMGLNPSTAIGLHMERTVGAKSKIIEIARRVAPRHGLKVPRSSKQIAGDPLLAALVLEDSRTTTHHQKEGPADVN